MKRRQLNFFLETAPKKRKDTNLTEEQALNQQAHPESKYSHQDLELLKKLVTELKLQTQGKPSQYTNEDRRGHFYNLYSHIETARDNTKDEEKTAELDTLLNRGIELKDTISKQISEPEVSSKSGISSRP